MIHSRFWNENWCNKSLPFTTRVKHCLIELSYFRILEEELKQKSRN